MKKLVVLAMIFTFMISCKDEPKKDNLKNSGKDTLSIATIDNEILESAVIYEANIRQYSPEGSFDAFTKDIPQLKELGVKVIWLMPMYPISEKNRKATGGRDVEDIDDPEERKK
ncbi:MAG: alpha-amylase, partial [Gramella sp.]|nr:alpha-amylase [Christiangramia sp.]